MDQINSQQILIHGDNFKFILSCNNGIGTAFWKDISNIHNIYGYLLHLPEV